MDERQLLEINQNFLNHDYHTDVITFQSENEKVGGDVFISIDFVLDYVQKNGLNFRRELARTIIHGVLHMFGFNDKTEDQILQMRIEEEKALSLHPLLA